MRGHHKKRISIICALALTAQTMLAAMPVYAEGETTPSSVTEQSVSAEQGTASNQGTTTEQSTAANQSASTELGTAENQSASTEQGTSANQSGSTEQSTAANQSASTEPDTSVEQSASGEQSASANQSNSTDESNVDRGATDAQSSGDELNTMQAETSDTIQITAMNANVTFNTFRLQMTGGAEKTESIDKYAVWNEVKQTWDIEEKEKKDVYVWSPTSSSETHYFSYNLQVAANDRIETGAVEIKLPYHILRDSNGDFADTLEMSILRKDVYESADSENKESVLFVYTVDETNNQVIVTNVNPIDTAYVANMPFRYKMTKSTYEYRDMGVSETVLAQGVIYETDGTKAANEADAGSVYINTNVKLDESSLILRQMSSYQAWSANWGETPSDADTDFEKDPWVYLMFSAQSKVISEGASDVTQNYTVQMEHLSSATIDVESPLSGELVAVKMQGKEWTTDLSEENFKVSGLHSTGTRTDSYVVRYPKSVLNAEFGLVTKFTDSVKIHVLPESEIDEETTGECDKDSSYQAPKQLVYKGTRKSYTHVQVSGLYGDNNNYVYSSNQIADYHLYDFLDGEDPKRNLQYEVYAMAWAYDETLEAGWTKTGTEADIDHYGKKNITYELVNPSLSVRDVDGGTGNYISLESGDYYVNSLDVDFSIYMGAYDEDTCTFEKRKYEDGENIQIELYVQTEVDGDWKKAAVSTYNGNNQWQIVDSSLITSASDNWVSFVDAKVLSWKFVTANASLSSYLRVVPSITLYPATSIKDLVSESNARKIALNDRASVSIHASEDDLVSNHSGSGDLYFAELRKLGYVYLYSDGQGENDILNNVYRAPWTLYAEESYTDETGQNRELQQGGTFHVLLPVGGVLDRSSLRVSSFTAERITAANADNTAAINAGDYTVTIDKNVEVYGDKCTIVTIQITKPGYGYKVDFSTLHSHEDIQEYGRSLSQLFVYQSGNQTFIQNEYANNSTSGPSGGMNGLSKASLQAMAEAYDAEDLAALAAKVDDRETPSLGLIGAQHYISALVFNLSGIQMMATGTASDLAKRVAEVGQGQEYVYNVRMKNTIDTNTKDIVILDSIENFGYTENDGAKTAINDSAAYGLTGNWKGTPKYLDLSELKNRGIAYRVYFTQNAAVDLSKYQTNDESLQQNFVSYVMQDSADGWRLVPDNSANGIVSLPTGTTAYMIDLTEKSNGDEFVLKSSESLSFNLVMQAPTEITQSKGSDGRLKNSTYNNIYCHQLSYAADGTGTVGDKVYSYFHQDYTTVNLKVKSNLNLLKTEEGTGTPIADVVFRVSGTSDYGTVVDQTYTTNSKGELIIENLEQGTYTLQEVDAPSDFQKIKDRQLTITEHGIAMISEVNQLTPYDAEGNELALSTEITYDAETIWKGTLTDLPRIHGDLTFTKVDETGDPLEGAVFVLTGISAYGNLVDLTAVSDEKGNVSFEDVEYTEESYVLEETQVPDGFAPVVTKYSVSMETEDDSKIASLTITDQDNDEYEIITNHPYVELQLSKRDADNHSEILFGAEFVLRPTKQTLQMIDFSTMDSLVWLVEKGKYVQTVTTDVNGLATFTNLVPGCTYEMEEVTAPKNHELTEGIFVVTVDTDGDITIIDPKEQEVETRVLETTGLEYDIYNERTYDGEATIIKKWVGQSPETFGPDNFPVITIKTEEPTYEQRVATIDKTKFQALFPETTTEFVRLDVGTTYETIEDVKAGVAEVSSLEFTEVQTSPAAGQTRTGTIYMSQEGTKTYFWTDAAVVYLPENCRELFKNRAEITEINFEKFNSENVTNMQSMFDGCKALVNVQEIINHLSLKNVTDMSSMFNECQSFHSAVFPEGCGGSKVTTMYHTFHQCAQLEIVDLRKTKIGQTTVSLDWCFAGVGKGLEEKGAEIYLPEYFRMKDCDEMFEFTGGYTHNTSIETIIFGEYTYVDDTDLSGLFAGAHKHLTLVDFGAYFDATQVTDMSFMFSQTYLLQNIDLTNVHTSEALVNTKSMFTTNSEWQELDKIITFGSEFIASNVCEMESMFGSQKIQTIYVPETFQLGTTGVVYDKVFQSYSGTYARYYQLVGGNGTALSTYGYRPGGFSSSYAVIDGLNNQRGYFTLDPFADASSSGSGSGVGTAGGSGSGSGSSTGTTGGSGSGSGSISGGSIESTDTTVEYKTSSIGTLVEGTTDQYEVAETAVLTAGGEELEVPELKAIWTKNSDTEWVLTLHVYDPDAAYYVVEGAYEGYASAAMLTDASPYGLSETPVTLPQTIKNTYVTADSSNPSTPGGSGGGSGVPSTENIGTLELTNQFVDERDVILASEEKAHYTVTLRKADGSALTGKEHFGVYEFVNGVANVNLGASETAVFHDIPADYTYEVTLDQATIGFDFVSFKNENDSDDSDGQTGVNNGAGKQTIMNGTIVADTKKSVTATQKQQTAGFILKSEVSLYQNGISVAELPETEAKQEFGYSISMSALQPNRLYMLEATDSGEEIWSAVADDAAPTTNRDYRIAIRNKTTLGGTTLTTANSFFTGDAGTATIRATLTAQTQLKVQGILPGTEYVITATDVAEDYETTGVDQTLMTTASYAMSNDFSKVVVSATEAGKTPTIVYRNQKNITDMDDDLNDTDTEETISIYINLEWLDTQGEEMDYSDWNSVYVRVYKENFGSRTLVDGKEQEIQYSYSSKQWMLILDDLPKSENGSPCTYTVEAVTPSGFKFTSMRTLPRSDMEGIQTTKKQSEIIEEDTMVVITYQQIIPYEAAIYVETLGDYADDEQEFTFTMELEEDGEAFEGTVYGEIYTMTNTGADDDDNTDDNDDPIPVGPLGAPMMPNTLELEFTKGKTNISLKNGQSLYLYDIPDGTTLKVTQKNGTAEGYEMKSLNATYENWEAFEAALSDSGPTYSTHSDLYSDANSQTLTFTSENTVYGLYYAGMKNGAIPTGLETDTKLLLQIGGYSLVALMLLMVNRRRRNQKQDKH